MIFKEALKNDLGMISPAPELLGSISRMMREEAEKPRLIPIKTAVRFAGTAAAVTLLAFGALRVLDGMNGTVSTDTAENAGAAETAPQRDEDGFILYKAQENKAEANFAEGTPEPENASDAGSASVADAADAPAAEAENDSAPETTTAPAAMPFFTFADESGDCLDIAEAPAEWADDGVFCDARTPAPASGGDELGLYYGLSDPKISAIDGEIIDTVGEAEFDNWRTGKKYGGTTEITEEVNLYALILDFPQHREAIRARLLELIETDRKNGWEPRLTEEDVAVLLDGEKNAVVERFASPAAVTAEGRIYTPEWLDTHTAADYEAERLPKDQLREKLDEILWLSHFMDLTALTEKLSEYLGEPVTVPEWTEADPEPAPAEAVPEDLSEEYPEKFPEELSEE